jgi:hypothetical protein
MSDKPKHTYKAPVPPQAGYRRGFEPRPGESDSERLKRELEELKRRVRGRASGANYDHYRNAKGGKIKKMAKGGKLTDLTGDGKVTRADVLKGRGVPGFSKGGSASKRADGCATKGKTKGKMV